MKFQSFKVLVFKKKKRKKLNLGTIFPLVTRDKFSSN